MPNDIVNRENYFYSTVIIPALAAGASFIDQVRIQADGDFLIRKTAYYASYAGTPAVTDDNRPLPGLVVDVIDNGSGARLTREPVFISTFAGYGALPMIWTQPRLVAANSSIEVNFRNVSTVDLVNVQLTFIGERVQYGTR